MPFFKTKGKIVYYAHVPKCAGSSVEDYLAERFGSISGLNRRFKPRRETNWTATSPQHMTAAELDQIFAPGFFDCGFSVVRDPAARVVSAFHYHRDYGKRIPADVTFADFVSGIESFSFRDHRRYDNHFLPQAAFVPEWCVAFKMEEGLAAVERWLDQQTEESVSATIPDSFKGGYKKDPLAPDVVRVIERFYDMDYRRFGYEKSLAEDSQDGSIFAATVLPDVLETPKLKNTVGVFIHVFYEDVLPKIMERVKRIPFDCSVYISTTPANDLDFIRAHAPGAEIRVFQNRGRDIWPKIWGFQDKYDAHQYILHLHTKKSTHSKNLQCWADHIFDSILGGDRPRQIVTYMETHSDLGIVAPSVPAASQRYCDWRGNLPAARPLAKKLGIKVEKTPHPFRFPAGSMFWARADILRRFSSLSLPQSYFPAESGQVDGTPAHAVERLLGVTAEATGARLVYVDHPKDLDQ